ncbi:hypothetical protein AB0C38_17505 [Amycolatopsis sp. NPDC048633]|uniref:hypothetical protein n=1 Tax=Amycolatopsis sp. NPDC048633 TaxID=3157095 RepID=UPI0033CB9652
MRILARIGAALGIAALVAGATTGVAAAAPPGFTVVVNHSTGGRAMSVTATMSWSASARTVTFGHVTNLISADECANITLTGFQGSTRVATYPDDDLGLCTHDGIDHGIDYGTLSLTTTVPGGIDHVVIRLTDVNHKISHYANCYRTASTCQQG